MSTTEIKAEINAYIAQVDDASFLKVLHSMLDTYTKEQYDPIIGYEADGTPVYASIARKQFDEDLKNREGFMSLEDFEKELTPL